MQKHPLETEDDRRGFLLDWDCAFIDGIEYPCLFDRPSDDLLEVTGDLPTVVMTDEDVIAAGVVIDTSIDRIDQFTGFSARAASGARAILAFKVKEIQPDGSGHTTLVLEEQ